MVNVSGGFSEALTHSTAGDFFVSVYIVVSRGSKWSTFLKKIQKIFFRCQFCPFFYVCYDPSTQIFTSKYLYNQVPWQMNPVDYLNQDSILKRQIFPLPYTQWFSKQLKSQFFEKSSKIFFDIIFVFITSYYIKSREVHNFTIDLRTKSSKSMCIINCFIYFIAPSPPFRFAS